MLITEPPLGRRTARAAFAVDVLVAPALLPVEDGSAPAAAAENVIVGAADEESVGEARALLPIVEDVTQLDVGGAA